MNKDILHELFEYRDGKLFWKVVKSKKTKIDEEAGSITSDGYRSVMINYKNIATHRIIYMMFNNTLPKELDHIDGNRLNNNIDNLREVTSCQNSCNTKLRADNKSGIKGISWSKRSKKWHAYLNINNKRKNIGFFKDIFEAEKQVIYYRQLYHGEFANNG